MKTQTIQTITKADIPTLLSMIPNGQVFTVTFTKKPAKFDLFGEERVLNCRKGVKKFLSENPNKKARAEGPKHLVKVYDMQLGDYRQFNMETTKTIKAMGHVFEIVANA